MSYSTLPSDVVGKVFENNAGQKYIVESVNGKKPNGSTTYKIRFLETGYERIIEKVEIKRGKIKDKFEKSIIGIAWMGDVKMVNHKREYNIWHKMLERCYDERNRAYGSYGAKGVTVNQRWFCFENFVNDIPLLDGYDEDLFKKGLLFLDKDIKQQGVTNKIYSKETCCLVDFETNSHYRDYDHRKKRFYGLSPNDELTEIFGLKEFCRETGLHRVSVARCLSKNCTSTRGWKFSYNKEELIS